MQNATVREYTRRCNTAENIHIIVNRGDWLWNPANIKGANKDAKIYVGRSTTLHNLLFCAHTLWMNYVTNTFLLVSSSVRSKQLLCFVQGQSQKNRPQNTTKNFVEFQNHSLLLPMVNDKPVVQRSISGCSKTFPVKLYVFIIWCQFGVLLCALKLASLDSFESKTLNCQLKNEVSKANCNT